MPYGHKRQYLELIAEVSRQRVEITKRQQRQIAAAYQEIAEDMERQLAGKSKRSLTYRWLQDYAMALRRGSKALYAGLEDVVTGNMLDIAQAVVGVQMSFFGETVPEISGRFSDVFSSIPQRAVNELMHGGVYQDFTGLSERLWDYRRKFDRDISEIVNNGITAQRNAFDLAKDLEQYLHPGAVHPWEWSKVYPGVNKTVDYSAQRLARTSVTHAYQLSTVRATRQNPFVEAYRWLSSGGRACPLCMERNNKLYPKDAVPLDHPNGMCTIIPEIKKSYEQIADELGEWAAGGENPALDQWLQPSDAGGTMGLSAGEIRAVNQYVSGESYALNDALRRGGKLTAAQRVMAANLDSALQKMPTYEGVVYRSVHIGDDSIVEFMADYKPGATISPRQFYSTSVGVYDERFNVQYVIESRNGRDIRTFNLAEQEILFPRGSRFKVSRVEGNTIYMREM